MAQAQRADAPEEQYQESGAPAPGKKPAETVRVENVEAAIWSNPSSNGAFYNATFSKKYKDGEGKTHNSSSFGSADLLALQEAARQTYSKIQELRQKDRAQAR
jgi:hypothetical protein